MLARCRRTPTALIGSAFLVIWAHPIALAAGTCVQPADGAGVTLPVTRTIEIDPAAGTLYGSMTRQPHERSFLRPMEVVLSFDDGPMPWVTRSILDTLDRFCTKATFFSVGRMALAYPATVRDVIARGHTLGSHTYTHPFNMPLMKREAAEAEIERGLAAVATAVGGPIAPFFRFPGLGDGKGLLGYLRRRGIATFTVDVVSNDSYIHDKQLLIDRTLAEVKRNRGGIILFHDIKTTTAKALPEILARLKAEGFSVVHLTSKTNAEPLADMMSAVAPKLAKAAGDSRDKHSLVPFYGAIGPEKGAAAGALQATSVPQGTRKATSGGNAITQDGPQKSDHVASHSRAGGWVTKIKRREQTADTKPVP